MFKQILITIFVITISIILQQVNAASLETENSDLKNVISFNEVIKNEKKKFIFKAGEQVQGDGALGGNGGNGNSPGIIYSFNNSFIKHIILILI